MTQAGTSNNHTVLFDHDKTAKENDSNYYFKNSYLSNPWITVPKHRPTTDQTQTFYQCADQGEIGQKFQNVLRADVGVVTSSTILQIFNEELTPITLNFDKLDTEQDSPMWTINDEAYAITFEKI